MAKTFLINFRVTTQDHERIKNIAKAKGCRTVSAFIRKLTLEQDLWLEKKVQETNLLVREIHSMLKKKN